MVLTGAGGAFLHQGVLSAGVVQHVGAPVAGVGPALHGAGELHKLVAFQVVAAQGVGIILGHAVEQTHGQALDEDVGGMGGLPAAGHLRAIGGAVAVGVPGIHAFLIVLDPLQVDFHVRPRMHAVLQASLAGPVAAVHEAVVGPLGVVVLGDHVDLAVVLAQLPVLSGHLRPGLGGIGLQHFLAQGQESAALGVGPSVQPVGSGAHQVHAAVLGGQGQVVVGRPVGPLDPTDLEGGVHLLVEDLVDLGQHFVRAVRGDVAGHQIGHRYVLRGVDRGLLSHGGKRQDEHHHRHQECKRLFHGVHPPFIFFGGVRRQGKQC